MRVKRTCVGTIVTHARAAAPAECCGILVGDAGGIVDALPARNTAATPETRYTIDPQDHFNAIRRARQLGLQVVGFYHSHPRTAAVPSDTDREQANYPRHTYVIVSLAVEPPELAAYELVDGNFQQVVLVTTD